MYQIASGAVPFGTATERVRRLKLSLIKSNTYNFIEYDGEKITGLGEEGLNSKVQSSFRRERL